MDHIREEIDERSDFFDEHEEEKILAEVAKRYDG